MARLSCSTTARSWFHRLQYGETIGSVTLTSTGTPATTLSLVHRMPLCQRATGGTFNPNNYTISYVNGG